MVKCPLCFSKPGNWTDDPILTPDGIAGEDYIGCTYIKDIHITEIQEKRNRQEEILGLTQTSFSPVLPRKGIQPKHIQELRDSTERILEEAGVDLDYYFNFDEDGLEHNEDNHQIDWTELNLNQDRLYIRARHIEELRHYIDVQEPVESDDDEFSNIIGVQIVDFIEEHYEAFIYYTEIPANKRYYHTFTFSSGYDLMIYNLYGGSLKLPVYAGTSPISNKDGEPPIIGWKSLLAWEQTAVPLDEDEKELWRNLGYKPYVIYGFDEMP